MFRIGEHSWVFVALWVLGCQSAPADAREWKPTDHDHTDNPNAAQVEIRDGAAAGSPAAMMGIDEVTLAAWKSSCTVCHGIIGRGDGPKGPGTHARDLSDPKWHEQITDDQIAVSIKKGKGQMPAFDLPDSTIKGLVKLVRLINAARITGGDDDDEEMGDQAPGDGGARDAGRRDGGPRDAGRKPDGGKPRALDAGKPSGASAP